MTVLEGIRALLTGKFVPSDSGRAAAQVELVNLMGTNWYLDEDSVPQGKTLYGTVYPAASTRRDQNMDGASGMREARIQVDVWASTRSRADDAAALAERVLDGFYGTVSAKGESVAFQEVVLELDHSGLFEDGDGSDGAQRRATLEFFVRV